MRSFLRSRFQVTAIIDKGQIYSIRFALTQLVVAGTRLAIRLNHRLLECLGMRSPAPAWRLGVRRHQYTSGLSGGLNHKYQG